MSDWSSDVCSSDLDRGRDIDDRAPAGLDHAQDLIFVAEEHTPKVDAVAAIPFLRGNLVHDLAALRHTRGVARAVKLAVGPHRCRDERLQIGRASCQERVCKYG